jgi:hypothetical protein
MQFCRGADNEPRANYDGKVNVMSGNGHVSTRYSGWQANSRLA